VSFLSEKTMTKLSCLAPAALACLAAFAPPTLAQAPSSPEAASGFTAKQARHAKHFMVAAANPLATEAGYRILKQGGSAVDAAIAVQMVLTLVEPQSSGIGGGAFMMVYDRKANRVHAYDGRETAPLEATETLFQDAEGKPLKFYDAVVGGRSVGTPGVVRLLEMTHAKHGKVAWAKLFEPAIELAEKGFAVSPRLNTLLKSEQHLRKDPVAAGYFYDAQGNPHPVGHVLKNPELAATLRLIASEGSSPFYRGPIAWDIVDKVRRHAANPGRLSQADFVAYQPKERPAVCTDYRRWVVCGFPPPSSGGIAVAQMLAVLEGQDLASAKPAQGVPNAQGVHWMAEAGRLAFADRNQYVADPDFVDVPQGLLDRAYLKQRAALIGDKSMGKAQAGQPPGTKAALADDQSPELPSTSHISVVDRQGNAISMTTTIEDQFGSRQMVRGFLLNNQLTDFSFASQENGKPIANRIQPGKRPRSSMAPTLVFEKKAGGERGALALTTGSPGGSLIINYVAKTLFATLDWGLDMQQAIALPNFSSRNGPTELEKDRVPESLVEALKAKGHEVRTIEMTSGLQGIRRVRRGGQTAWEGGADPRREGIVLGD
jgi:gamma-glutamyltranspeptidase/glutathione hydrolase